MQLEINDLFVVTRGEEKVNHYAALASMMSREPGEVRVEYDKRYEGIVFRALAVNGPMVAAKIECGNRSLACQMISLDISRLEIWPVNQAYLDAMQSIAGRDFLYSGYMMSNPFSIPKGLIGGK